MPTSLVVNQVEPGDAADHASFPFDDDDDEDRIAQVSFSWWLAFLLGIFGISSWVAINGLWMQLPLLFSALPEGWRLPAYLSPIIQIANFAPIVYMLLTRICRSYGRRDGPKLMQLIQPPERLANYIILVFGFISAILLTQFWDVVVIVNGLPPNENTMDSSPMATNGHSVGLFALTFILGMIDCMSSVTFIAYLANMPSAFAGALLFGETCSGLIPSLVALVQGASSEPLCIYDNVTNSTNTFYSPPRFSVSVFMGILAAITFLSLAAFFLLDCLSCGLGRSVTLAYQKVHSLPQNSARDEKLSKMSKGSDIFTDDSIDANVDNITDDSTAFANGNPTIFFMCCFLVISYASCLGNGFLPSIQAYSTASYDTRTFHLTVTLSGLAAPIFAILVTTLYDYNMFCLHALSFLMYIRQFFCRQKPVSENTDGDTAEVKRKSKPLNVSRLCLRLLLLVVLSAIPSAYIIYLAAASPNPPMLGGFGSALAILSWITATALFTIQRTWITLILVQYGTQRNLRVLGVFTQIGACVGALVSFLLTAQANLFVSKTPCSP